MAKVTHIDNIKGLFGPLVLYEDTAQNEAFYVGPKNFLESALFQECLGFRSQFRVVRIINRTIFTVGLGYRLFPGIMIPQALSRLLVDDAVLSMIVEAGEKAIN